MWRQQIQTARKSTEVHIFSRRNMHVGVSMWYFCSCREGRQRKVCSQLGNLTPDGQSPSQQISVQMSWSSRVSRRTNTAPELFYLPRNIQKDAAPLCVPPLITAAAADMVLNLRHAGHPTQELAGNGNRCTDTGKYGTQSLGNALKASQHLT